MSRSRSSTFFRTTLQTSFILFSLFTALHGCKTRAHQVTQTGESDQADFEDWQKQLLDSVNKENRAFVYAIPNNISKKDRESILASARMKKPGPEADADVQEALRKRRAYVSLTTSPKRLSTLPAILATLDLGLVTKVFVALPEKFGRDGKSYDDIPAVFFRHPKVQLLRPKNDFGPITKMLPAAEYLVGTRSTFDDILVSLDDDTSYPAHHLNQLIGETLRNSRTVVALSGQNLGYWGAEVQSWPDQANASNCPNAVRSNCDVIEGFGGVAYPVKYLDVTDLSKLSQISRECFASDDLVISFVLAKSQIRRMRFSTDVLNLGHLTQLEWGFQEDALHRGGGLGVVSETEINAQKYRKCASDLGAYFQK